MVWPRPNSRTSINSSTLQGHIAKLIGMPRHSRHVGQGADDPRIVKEFIAHLVALKFLSPNPIPPVPWHRVIGASGAISSRGPGTTGAQRQRDSLVVEGIQVTAGRTGDLRIDFATYGWFPQQVVVSAVNANEESGSEAESDVEN